MKTLLTFLAFNVVLLICCYEKKCAGSMSAWAPAESVDTDGTFKVRFSAGKSMDEETGAFTEIVVDNGFIKGYVLASSRKHIEIAGAINNRNEVILIQSANGELTYTFKGRFRKTGKNICLLSGNWTRIIEAGQTDFSNRPQLVNTVKSQAFSFSSK